MDGLLYVYFYTSIIHLSSSSSLLVYLRSCKKLLLNMVRVMCLMSCFLNIIFIKYIDLECSTLLLLLQWLHLINYCKFSLAIFIFLLFFLHKRYLETFSIDIRVRFSPMIKELDSNEFTSLAFFNRSRFDFGELTCAQDTEFNQ